MRKTIHIGQRKVGAGHPCFIIAEAGVNHGGNLKRALAMVDAAADAGADAVKFQTFSADALVVPNAPKADYQRRNTRSSESQWRMLKKLELSPAMHRAIAQRCRQKHILFMSSPFDEKAADFLGTLHVKVFKIASGEITNLAFLKYVAQKKRPIILSTGMATLHEVESAYQTISQTGNNELILLQCVSDYPANARDANLRAMRTMQERFHIPVGYSDHTLGVDIAFAAVAMGACVLEKHFTLNKHLPGPDQRASLDTKELNTLVHGIRRIESAFGSGKKEPAAREWNTRQVARKSLVASRPLLAGSRLTSDMVERKRPGTGLSAAMLESVLGKTLKRGLDTHELIRVGDLK